MSQQNSANFVRSGSAFSLGYILGRTHERDIDISRREWKAFTDDEAGRMAIARREKE